MKKNRRAFIPLLLLLLFLSLTAQSFADVRVIIRPWWPGAIVVAPPLPPPPYGPPMAPPDVGFVDLNVQPGDTSIYVDVEYRGIASNFSCEPDCLTLTRGRHSISLQKTGYKTANFIVHVSPHKIIELDITLDLLPKEKVTTEETYQIELEKTGFLTFQVKPQDAAVYIDGNFYGIVSEFSESKESIVLRSGKHKVEIAKPGYKTYTTHVEISDGKIEKINIKLERVP